MAFKENGTVYWLTFTQKTLDSLLKAEALNKPVDLFLIKLGAIKQDNTWTPVLLVDNFQEAK